MEAFAQFWDQFMAYLRTQPPELIHGFLFLCAFMENVLPPIPGDSLIVFGAYLAGIGVIGVVPAYLAMWAGSTLGCMLVYGVAYWKGRELFLRLPGRLFSAENLAKTEDWFTRHGIKVVIFNRFLPTVRAFVGVVAGISRMHPVKMLVYVLLGTFLWNSILVCLGVMVGENWELVVHILDMYNRVLIGSMVVAAGGFALWRWRRRGVPPCTP